jgi:hypothetical protein
MAARIGIDSPGEMSLSEHTIYNFRNRLFNRMLEYPEEGDLLFDQFSILLDNFVGKLGIKTGAQRTDSTLFMSNIKKSGRLALALDVLRKCVRAIPEESRPAHLAAALGKDYYNNVTFYAAQSETEALLTTMLRHGAETLEILKTLPECEEFALMQRFLAEQAETGEDGLLTPKAKNQISSRCLFRPDPASQSHDIRPVNLMTSGQSIS